MCVQFAWNGRASCPYLPKIVHIAFHASASVGIIGLAHYDAYFTREVHDNVRSSLRVEW
jgi:hypothetical protein